MDEQTLTESAQQPGLASEQAPNLQRAVEEPAEAKPSSKKSLGIVAVVLAAVIALASVGYGALANQRAASSGQAGDDAASSVAADGNAESVAAQGSSAESSGATEEIAMDSLDFTVQDMQGGEVSLSSMKGKPTVLGFWATWCPPCNEEAPTIEEMNARYGDRINFMMVDVTDGQRETSDIVKQWYEEKGYTYPVYLDANLEASTIFGASKLPTTFIFDAQGNIIDMFLGAMPEDDMAQMLEGLLGS